VAGACGDDGPSDSPGDDAEDTDVEVGESADSGTTPPEDLGCYADWASIDDDGTVEGTGYDQYDPVRHDLLIHLERHYDLGLHVIWDLEYDAAGNQTSWTQDGNGDGTADVIDSYAYDDANNLVHYERDNDADGTADVVYDYVWDTAGNLVAAEFDFDGDGDPDYAYQYVYDAEGRRLTATEDQDGDGQTDWWYTYTYDEVGRGIGVSGDEGNDGTIDYLQTVTYSDPELLSGTAVTDEGNDGVPDEIDVVEFDAEGRLLFHEEDLLADGYPDLIESFEYDPVSGLVVTEDTEEHDPPPDHDNVYVWHREWQYDELLRIIEHSYEYSEVVKGDDRESSSLQTWTFAGTCP
jgi:hypothetical protein